MRRKKSGRGGSRETGGGFFPSSLRILLFRFSPSLFSIRAALHYLNAWKRLQGNHQTSIHLQQSNQTTLPTDRAGTALETIFLDPEIEVAGPRPLLRFELWAPTNGEQMMYIRKIQIFIRNSLFLQSRFSHVYYANNASYLAQRISDLLPHSNCRSVTWVG